ncbi:unnamed protein product, partial [marine sediment metagenome]
TSYEKCKNSLTKNGIFVTVDPQSTMFRYMLNKKVRGYMGGVNGEKLDSLRELIEAGKVKSVVDKVYPLSQVAEAHRFYETGQKKGKIGISLLD